MPGDEERTYQLKHVAWKGELDEGLVNAFYII